VRERGTVRWWKDDKGYGRINGSDGTVLFCHFSFIEMDGFRSLGEGDVVEFERQLGAGPHGPQWQAHRVIRIEQAGGGGA
jgi:CspA family cold shock protein